MQTLEYSVRINASPEQVWKCLSELENYKLWTAPFCPGSYYKTSHLAEGSRIHFLTPSGEGMYSQIDKLTENKLLAFRHLGVLHNFEELPITEETQSWTNSMETYELHPLAEGTEVRVNVDTLDSYNEFMDTTFPLALQELKRISELN